MHSTPPTLQDIRTAFDELGTAPERLEYLVELGGTLPGFPAAARVEANRVQGCQSRTWLVARELPGQPPRWEFLADVRILGPGPDEKAGIVTFVVDGLPADDVARALDARGVAIRAGHHCAMPLHERLGIDSSSRASFWLYNSPADVDRLVETLGEAIRMYRR